VTAVPAADVAGRPARDLEGRLAAAVVGESGVIGVGIDAVDLDRFRTVLGRRPRLAGRLFTGAEQAYAALAPDPVPRLATRFAAKEAAMKALGVGLWSFRLTDVEVVRDGLEAPVVVLHDGAAALAASRGVAHWHLSLTHTDTVALAVVVATAAAGRGVRPPAGGD